MPQAGDSFIVEIKEAHIMWGEFHPSRHSHSRREVYGEGYIQIPVASAYNCGIFNKIILSEQMFGITAHHMMDIIADDYLLKAIREETLIMLSNFQKKET